MKDFKLNLAAGDETQTSANWIDANGKAWPIYAKRVTVTGVNAPMPNAGTSNTAHGISALKLDGHFAVRRLRSDDGTNTYDERTGATTISVTATNLVITTTANLSTHLRTDAIIEYCKTTD